MRSGRHNRLDTLDKQCLDTRAHTFAVNNRFIELELVHEAAATAL